MRLSKLRGRFVVVSFLYTHCPDVCPLIADNLNRALARNRGLTVLAVSVDPKGDTPASVRRFVRAHRLRPGFRYLTGTRAQLQPIWNAYHLAVMPGKDRRAQRVQVLVDRRGDERLLYDSQVKGGGRGARPARAGGLLVGKAARASASAGAAPPPTAAKEQRSGATRARSR